MVQVLDPLEVARVQDRDHVKEADEIVEGVGQVDEKISLFRDLEEKGDGEQEGQDEDAAQHEALDALEPLGVGIRDERFMRIHLRGR